MNRDSFLECFKLISISHSIKQTAQHKDKFDENFQIAKFSLHPNNFHGGEINTVLVNYGLFKGHE